MIKGISLIIQRNSRNHLHIQHPRFNFLNINTKLVTVEATPPHFYPTPKISRRFKKTSARFASNTVMFF